MEASVRPGAALWITGATFLYFSGCNAHSLSLSSPSLRVSPSLSLSFFHPRRLSSRCFPFTLLFPCSPVVVLRYSPSTWCVRARMLRVFPSVHTHRRLPLLSFHSSQLASTRDSLPFNGTDEDSSSLPDPPSPLRIVTLRVEMETAPVSYSWGSCARETELPDNPLICPVITSHRRSSADFVPSSTANRTNRLESRNATPVNKPRTYVPNGRPLTVPYRVSEWNYDGEHTGETL